MFPRTSRAIALGAASFLATSCLTIWVVGTPAYASDIVYAGGGALPQVVDGGGSRTTITLINLDGVMAPYTLFFYDDNGNPMVLSTTAGVPASILSGTLDPFGSVTIKTSGSAPSTSQGWALLVTENTIAGSAVFGIPLSGLYNEASCPLDTGSNSQFGLPFDSTTAVTGVAISNSWLPTSLAVGVTVYDVHGNQLLTDTFTLPGNGHTSFLLTARYPQLATQQGFVIFSGSYYMNVLGLRATSSTFTSVTPIVASGW
jgi:hypothetical protein